METTTQTRHRLSARPQAMGNTVARVRQHGIQHPTCDILPGYVSVGPQSPYCCAAATAVVAKSALDAGNAEGFISACLPAGGAGDVFQAGAPCEGAGVLWQTRSVLWYTRSVLWYTRSGLASGGRALPGARGRLAKFPRRALRDAGAGAARGSWALPARRPGGAGMPCEAPERACAMLQGAPCEAPGQLQ